MDTMKHQMFVDNKAKGRSVSYIFKCFDKAWESTVPKRIDRKGFDVTGFSSKSFHKLVKDRGPQQQGLLTAIACGKHVTKDALVHYAHDDDTCPFCGARAGKDHRIYHCNGLHDLRYKYRSTVNWLGKQPQAVMHFGIVPDDCEATLLRQQTFNQGFHLDVPNPESSAEVFTDGTCFFNVSWEHALAGAAVIQVTGDYQWQLVERKILPSPDHSAYRGEVYAIFLALEHFWQVHINSDCAAVVKELDRMIHCFAEGATPTVKTHPDLWNPILAHLSLRRPGDVKVQKVKAHVDWKVLDNGTARREAFSTVRWTEKRKNRLLLTLFCCGRSLRNWQRRTRALRSMCVNIMTGFVKFMPDPSKPCLGNGQLPNSHPL